MRDNMHNGMMLLVVPFKLDCTFFQRIQRMILSHSNLLRRDIQTR